MKNFTREGGFRPDDARRPKFGNGFGGARKFNNDGNRPGGRPKFGDNREPKRLFQAVCSQCGKDCEVPFRPSGDKPVYCRDCFMKQPYVPGRNSNGNDGPRPQDSHRADPHDDAIRGIVNRLGGLEVKMDRILTLLAAKAERTEAAPVPPLRAPSPEETPSVKKPPAKKAAVVKPSKKSPAKTAKRK